MENTVSEPETEPESDVRFPIVLRGYDRRQVDEYVRVAEKRVDRHEKARRVAERRLAKAQVPAPRAAEPDEAAGLGRRIEKILQVAKSEAAEIKETAQQDARVIVARADEEAAAIRATHQTVLTQLSQIVDAVNELRDRIGVEAEAESPAEPESRAEEERPAEPKAADAVPSLT
ncbi:hypothetical protein Q5425_45405 [Amycolatopsis sp. A133]|uniref:DivIVA domain-containing protein n=1 Tax=Amycolatopsis sp. A133 TaxID=3064472 RepID=UPI0027F7AE37|nr:DivIVA domain-containing protein [Amycolatopsis sp. A133]MDQ7811007.1 hypothetical protein [Amycolatopsis sp. A133]